jgi:NADPH-dependent 2,4-dienoyl-CoA reductase/sulfur reductase-like enzyme
MFDVVVVGAGPAGLSAACAASAVGSSVLLVDDNHSPGGQIWRQTPGKPAHGEAGQMFDLAEKLGVQLWSGCTVFDAEPGRLTATRLDERIEIEYKSLILATGARELFLPFPGWTLPGAYGVGGLQALLKEGVKFEGKRIVIAGSGPLLLAVGAVLAQSGAEVIGIYEQAPLRQLIGFGTHIFFNGKLGEAGKYMRQLGSTPYEVATWVTAAHGERAVESVTLTDGRRTWTEPCDFLACSYGLTPNTELAELSGCDIQNGLVTVDLNQRTSVPNVFAVGELCGVGGLLVGKREGQVAGEAAVGKSNPRGAQWAKSNQAFRNALAQGFALRQEVLNLATPDTLVCRCEDVRLKELTGLAGRREAKLTTRLGMGPCQGRICGAAVQAMFGWERDRVRPPLYPVEARILATHKGDTE